MPPLHPTINNNMVEWDADYVPGVKLGMHCMQILLGFVIFILEIILFRSEDAVINGNNAWPFGLVSRTLLNTKHDHDC